MSLDVGSTECENLIRQTNTKQKIIETLADLYHSVSHTDYLIQL